MNTSDSLRGDVPKAVELLRQGRNEELWQMCCGFLSLNINEFMDIQKRLLLQQLELLNNCPLGKKIMRGARPKTVEEFRQLVPLTTYKDYCPELLEKREDVLPAKAAAMGTYLRQVRRISLQMGTDDFRLCLGTE